MPKQVEVVETYWTWCSKWNVPYPCRKRRTVTKWQYNFSWVQEIGWGLRCTFIGCEPRNRYVWSKWCLNRWGSKYFYNAVYYFTDPRRQEGECGGPFIEVHEPRSRETQES
jgi:hypothetical protein